MITGIGATGHRPLDQLRSDKTAPRVAALPVAASDEGETAPVSTASGLAAAGAPVDLDKVARIRAGIADGSYKAEPKAIAARMIALDIPAKA